MPKKEIAKLIATVIQNKGITDVKIIIVYPADSKHGDYSTNVALIAAKKVGKKPIELAQEIVDELEIMNQESGTFEKISVAGPGFINFTLSQKLQFKVLNNFKYPNMGQGRKVVVEYSSPNIAKPFTIGHLRSTIIGDAVANILKAVGYEVFRDNHLGDWGTQFGKQIYAIRKWGNEEEIEKSDRPVKMLVDLYVKFHQEAEKHPEMEDEARAWFKKLEDGDTEAKQLWQKCIEWSWKEFHDIYTRLGVSFTENNGRGYGEAFFEDKMQPVVEELKEQHLMKKGENGAELVFYPNDQYPPLMILKKDGATLYATRDLATDKFRLNRYGKDVLIINEVGAEQSLYFKQLYLLEEMLGWFKPEQRMHIKHGLYRFKEGKMSTRKGNVIWLEDVLREAESKAYLLAKEEIEFPKIGNELAVKKKDMDLARRQRAVAIGALKWNDLKRSPEQDIAFDWEEILNMKGNSGPYLQYTFARTQSVLRKTKEEFAFDFAQEKSTLSSEERELLRLLVRFADVVYEAARQYTPSTIATYLFEVAQAFNLFYQRNPILKETGAVKALRLQLTAQTGKILKEGLQLLGIQAPEQM